MTLFTEQVINIIKSIPIGKVMTYGQIAKFADNPRGARQVVRILHTMTIKYNLPWHRVINSKGEISFKNYDNGQKQIEMLIQEGICLNEDNKIDLIKYKFNPFYTELS